MINILKRADFAATSIIGFGILLRVWLFVSGRNPLDGDEAIMGMMGADIIHLVRIPIFFYGQHYMGTLEVPLIALLQSLGPESWTYSAWPLRLTGWTYFALLGVTHFMLCRYFFGRKVALWSLFFLCVGPYFWMEYSVRLRHAPLMMVMGESIALIAVTLREHWKCSDKLSTRWWLFFGVVVGLAWWHYQLVVVFFPAVLLIFASKPSPLIQFAARQCDESFGGWALRWSGNSLMILACASIAVLSLGKGSTWFWNHRESIYYPEVMAIILAVFFAGFGLSLFISRRSKGLESRLKTIPAFTLLGFMIACLPAMYYYATIDVEFWVPTSAFNASRFLPRVRDALLLEVAGFLEFLRYAQDLPSESSLGYFSYITLTAYALAFIATLKTVIRPSEANLRLGVLFFLILGCSTIFFNVIVPKPTTLEKPRFIMPVMLCASVLLGIMATHVTDSIMASNVRGRVARWAVMTTLTVGGFLMWGSGWMRIRPVEMELRSGFEQENVAIIRALEQNGVRRAMLHYHTDFMLLGHNLMFMSRMKIRFNELALTDRFIGLLDPADFPGPLYALEHGHNEAQLARKLTNGFQAGRFFVYPLPPGESMASYAKKMISIQTTKKDESHEDDRSSQ